MAEFTAIDEAAFEKATTKSGPVKIAPRALSARFDRRSHKVWVKLNSGIEFSFDTRNAYGLQDASADDLAGVTVEGVGSTLHFPKLDADFSVSRLLEGFLGPLDWTKREARAVASRENGKRGGRPRKDMRRSA
jgi:Protein of unknown function (DUF2442)